MGGSQVSNFRTVSTGNKTTIWPLCARNCNGHLVSVIAHVFGLLDFTEQSIGNLWNARWCFKGTIS